MRPHGDSGGTVWDVVVDVLRPHLAFADPGAPLEAEIELTSLGLDSMGLVELVVALEERFDIVFPEAILSVETFRSPSSVWTAVSDLLDSRGGPASSVPSARLS